MRILAIGDVESRYLWDFYEREKFEGIDLIISCGDLDPDYLSFLTTLTTVPVLYVHGNHDDRYARKNAEGCICIEDQIYVHEGIRILGLGGCMRYNSGKYQFTEREMRNRVARLRFQLFRRHGFDILVTHAPAFRLNDGRDLPHQGFRVFRRLLEKYSPRFFLHGHVHLSYGGGCRRYDRFGDTHVINVYERCVFDYDNFSGVH